MHPSCWTDYNGEPCTASARAQVIGDGRPILAACVLSDISWTEGGAGVGPLGGAVCSESL